MMATALVLRTFQSPNNDYVMADCAIIDPQPGMPLRLNWIVNESRAKSGDTVELDYGGGMMGTALMYQWRMRRVLPPVRQEAVLAT